MRRALALVGKIIERRNTIPILGNVMLTCDGETMTVFGTDLDMEASVAIPAEGEPFNITIGARLLADYIKGCVGPVALVADDKTATLSNDGMAMAVNLICPASDMPVMKFAAGGAEVITEALWRKTLAAVKTCCYTDDVRYYLRGAYIHPIDGKLRAVTTDGHRLAMYDTAVSWLLAPVILPLKAIKVMLLVMKPGGSSAVTVTQDGLKLRFAHPDWMLTTKIIDGKYPDYTRVIPKAPGAFETTLSHAQISRIPMVDRVVKLDPAKKLLTCWDPDGVTVTAAIHGKGGPVGFNLKYLMAFTRAHGTIKMQGDGAGDPATITTEDPAFTGVVMPMRM
jgi:DNA polymerase-3 subunit beta